MKLALQHIVSRLLHKYADYRIGATQAEKRCYKTTDSILLTFDDYGTKEEVHDILRILREKHVKAMFFLQGDWAHDNPKLVEAIKSDGHVVGNHTTTHAVLLGLPQAKIVSELAGGLPGPWLRPPEGRYDKRVRAIAAAHGYSICYWTIDSRDWTGASVQAMRHTILSELRPGATILFHLHGAHTRELLPNLIDQIRAKGFTLTDKAEQWGPAPL